MASAWHQQHQHTRCSWQHNNLLRRALISGGMALLQAAASAAKNSSVSMAWRSKSEINSVTRIARNAYQNALRSACIVYEQQQRIA